MKCDMCHRDFKPIGSTILMKWFQLVHFVEFLRSEEIIETQTAESMQDSLQAFKDFAYEEDAKDRKEWRKGEK